MKELTENMLNKALRLVRVYHDVTQTEAARRLDLSKSYISEIENGKKNVSLDILERYSKEFDIPVSSLMLFAEHADDPKFIENARTFIADKALKMLDWMVNISERKQA